MELRRVRQVTCVMCGKEFWRPLAWLRDQTDIFCSHRCNGRRRAQNPHLREVDRSKAWTVERRQKAREAMRGAGNPAWRGGVTVFRKHGNYSGVRYVRAPEWAVPMARKDGYVMEHRLLMASLCGYLMTRTEVVNHENHDPTDNRAENLTLWPDNRAHKLYEWGKCIVGTAVRTRYASLTTAESSGASPFLVVPSSLDGTVWSS